MLIRLDVPYADVRAGDLSLSLGDPPQRALERLALTVAGLDVELRLLGCSHQLLVDGGAACSETVACRPGRPGPLPRHRKVAGYTFRARTVRLERVVIIEDLLAKVAADPHGLAGVFGGDAFTALRVWAQPSALRWQTWHAYPQTGELVSTTGRLERPGLPA